MMTTKSIWVVEPDLQTGYGIRIDIADEDGFFICETNGEMLIHKVYIYNVEINDLISSLQEKKKYVQYI